MPNVRLNVNGGSSRRREPSDSERQAPTRRQVPQPQPEPDPAPEPEESSFLDSLDLYESDESDVTSARPATPQPAPEPEPLPSLLDDYEDEPEEEDAPKKRGKKKLGLPKKKNKKKSYKTADEAYAAYRRRRTVVFGCLIVLTVTVVTAGVYNAFFKHQLTREEAAVFTNKYNNQTQAQQWDSGIQSYLQANLKNMLSRYFQSGGDGASSFTVSNISVERNQPYGDKFLTFFSCDVTTNRGTDRVFCNIFIDTKDDKLKAASEVNITARMPYSNDDGKPEDNDLMEFSNDKNEIDPAASKEFQTTLENFLTLGYNNKQDVSSIYKGKTPLSFNGTFKYISACSVYKTPNQLGFNAQATYCIVLPSGFQYVTTSYYKIEKNSSGSYIINMIL